MEIINLFNRDGAKMHLVSEDNKLFTFNVDESHKWVLEHCRVGFMEDNKTYDFVDPSGGPFLQVGTKIDGRLIEAIVPLDEGIGVVLADKN